MTVSAIFLFDFGWFREQFCIIACPYGRMQSVMMDENSLVVAYDKKRGEPKRGTVPRDQEGDCINCYACVKVCPTGIDIRRGTQLECIACTNCIDACDEIMDKIKKPHGLIRYSSENELLGKKHSFFTIRSFGYLGVLILFVMAFIYFINRSTKPSLVFFRGTDSPFQVIMGPRGERIITNHFTLKITHQGNENLNLNLEVSAPELRKKIEIISPLKNMHINSPEIKTMMFFKFSPDLLINGSSAIQFNILKDNTIISTEELVLVGPNN